MKRIFNENYTPPVDPEEEQQRLMEERERVNEEIQRDDLAENDNPGGYNFGGNDGNHEHQD